MSCTCCGLNERPEVAKYTRCRGPWNQYRLPEPYYTGKDTQCCDVRDDSKALVPKDYFSQWSKPATTCACCGVCEIPSSSTYSRSYAYRNQRECCSDDTEKTGQRSYREYNPADYYSQWRKDTVQAVMCCPACECRAMSRHSRCSTVPRYQTEERRSDYTGKVPSNLCWDNKDGYRQNDDYDSWRKKLVPKLYVLPSCGPPLGSCFPCPYVRAMAYHSNHPRAAACNHDHTRLKQLLGYNRVGERSVEGASLCCYPCQYEPLFVDYCVRPPLFQRFEQSHGRCC